MNTPRTVEPPYEQNTANCYAGPGGKAIYKHACPECGGRMWARATRIDSGFRERDDFGYTGICGRGPARYVTDLVCSNHGCAAEVVVTAFNRALYGAAFASAKPERDDREEAAKELERAATALYDKARALRTGKP